MIKYKKGDRVRSIRYGTLYTVKNDDVYEASDILVEDKNGENVYVNKNCIELVEEEFVLPINWCVKVTQESRPYIYKYRQSIDYQPYEISNEYPYQSEEYGVIKIDKYTVISLEQFKKYVLKEETMCDKRKIIGYKTPYDLFQGEIKKGTIYKLEDFPFSKNPYNTEGEGRGGVTSLPKEIVESWEPVYEETTKTLVLGNKGIKITISKNCIIAEDKQFFINDLQALLIPRISSITTVATQGWSVELLGATYKIGCSTFTLDEIKLIVGTYKQINN